jgi:hypothetical protein
MALIDIDHDDWLANADRASFLFRHSLSDDPRLSHEAVAVFAGRFPTTSVDTMQAVTDPLLAVQATQPLDRPGEEVALAVEADQRWMTIKNLEQDPETRQLLDECLDAADVGLQLGPKMLAREGYIFLSAASSITPAHVDHEHNLLVQIRGKKKLTIGGFPSPEAEAKHLEYLSSGGYGRTGYMPKDPVEFVIEPGTGVYVPPRTVHMVENFGELCISLSLVFHTIDLERSSRIYQANAKLRRLGLHPRPPRQSMAVDKAKSGIVLTWQKLRQRSS